MRFEEVEPEEDVVVKNNPSVKNYFVTSKNPKAKVVSTHSFFKDRNLITPNEF
ncbi:Hypothetical protein FKW44_009510 [Caligus rogercresseyi]|uniref:Uncharacterized protein n=1 Tax=Caligus rogercresseyi TaxID=217165 RepID=A0A7T8HFF2_CALRO|nr:Hypothetical protein FKW44_009510 [Caligus rogercresseyi]